MSEAKTEAATPKRRQELRRKGQIARSQDLGGAAVLVAAIMAMRVFGGMIWDEAGAVLRDSFSQISTADITQSSAVAGSHDGMITTLKLLLPLFLVIPVVGVAASVAQGGLVFTLQPLSPKFERVNPLTNTKRLFFSVQGVVSLVKGLAKLSVVGTVAFLTLRSRADEVAALGQSGLRDGVAGFADITFDVSIRCAVALLVVALADYAYQRWQYSRDARMSKQEIRDEYRQMEGDPQMKARIRRQRNSLMARIMANVPKADVIITNPTHIAVALQYDPLTMAAPRVVAKGERLMAERIKKLAAEHRIPVMENKPLARALFKSVPVGRDVPAHLYQAVAEVLAYVFRLRTGRTAGARARAVA